MRELAANRDRLLLKTRQLLEQTSKEESEFQVINLDDVMEQTEENKDINDTVGREPPPKCDTS